MTRPESLEQGRAAYARNAWAEAYSQLSAADRIEPLGAEDLELLGKAAYLTGHDNESTDALARAHQQFLNEGANARAAGTTFWLAFVLLIKGEGARAAGWLARGQRVLHDNPQECAESGYLMIPGAMQEAGAGRVDAAQALFARALEIAERFHDRDLQTVARHGQGRAFVAAGDIQRGLALLDESMADIEAGAVSPIVAGHVYCSLIDACAQIFDVRRAQEWTASLSRWCEAQPDLVPYRGVCLIRRSELKQLHGEWDAALSEARDARARLEEPPPPPPSVGAALYQEGELHRLRGEFSEAEAAYRAASKYGRRPRPGLALLRLAQGEVDSALAIIRGLVSEAREPAVRCNVLAAQVEIALAAQELDAATQAADQLAQLAAALPAVYPRALAEQARGAVLLAAHDAGAALSALGAAAATWQELNTPYQAARTAELIGRAFQELGDADSAELEFDAARSTYQQLGASADLARLQKLTRSEKTEAAGGLSGREVQVLRLLARGHTNKAIARELFISEKTVARHVSNIFLKLGLSTRAAAAAYAFQHDLAQPST